MTRKDIEKLRQKIEENPDCELTQEEKDVVEQSDKCINALKKMQQRLDGHAIQNKNTTNKIALSFYYRNVVSYLILEELFDGEYHLDYKIENAISHLLPKDFSWTTTTFDMGNVYLFLYKMGYVEYKKEEGKNDDCFLIRITDDGKMALKNQIFESIASSCFYNYKTTQISRRSLYLSIVAIVLTSILAIITIFISIKP